MATIKRVVPYSEVEGCGYYEGLAQLGEGLGVRVVETEQGVWRWEECKLTRWLCDHVNLNKLWIDYRNGVMGDPHGPALLDLMRFYMQIGYSLGGFVEIFGHSLNYEEGQPDMIDAALELLDQRV